MVSGWKSRIIGGSIEGMLSDIIIAAGCNDVEINTYVEKGFAGKNTEVPDVVHLSYPSDPYFTGGKADGGLGLVDVSPSPWVKRLNMAGYYNLHNYSHSALFSCFALGWILLWYFILAWMFQTEISYGRGLWQLPASAFSCLMTDHINFAKLSRSHC
jgi:hypothetical protein